jgi:hypothetical protein
VGYEYDEIKFPKMLLENPFEGFEWLGKKWLSLLWHWIS